MHGLRKRSIRILLDSNIWRYFIDAGAFPALGNAARMSRHTVLISPATLYKAAHTSETSVRNALLAAMTKPWWKRLMPEAYSEAEEFKIEARRLRSEWLRPHPDLALTRLEPARRGVRPVLPLDQALVSGNTCRRHGHGRDPSC